MNEFETAVVNEQSVFEPSKFYCISQSSPVIQERHRSLDHRGVTFRSSGSIPPIRFIKRS